MSVVADVWGKSNGGEVECLISHSSKDICDLCSIMERVRYFGLTQEDIPLPGSRRYMEHLFSGINEEVMISILSELNVFYFFVIIFFC